VTAGTLFENTKLPLTKWFQAIYLMSADKGGISALRLSKMIGVSWRSAQRMLRKLRTAMGDRDGQYCLSGLIEVDDAYLGGKRAGKRGRGAAGKTPVMVGVERRADQSGFGTVQVVEKIDHAAVKQFAERIEPGATVRSDAYPALNILGRHCEHEARVTPPEKAGQWLPKVHMVIGNLKRFLLGTFHGVSATYLQEYIDEFVYRFNRRWWEDQKSPQWSRAATHHSAVAIQVS